MGFPIYILFLIHVLYVFMGWELSVEARVNVVDLHEPGPQKFSQKGGCWLILIPLPRQHGFSDVPHHSWISMWVLGITLPTEHIPRLFSPFLEHENDGTENNSGLHTSSSILPLITQESMREHTRQQTGA